MQNSKKQFNKHELDSTQPEKKSENLKSKKHKSENRSDEFDIKIPNQKPNKTEPENLEPD